MMAWALVAAFAAGAYYLVRRRRVRKTGHAHS